MKRLLLSSVALVALAVGPALAADMPRKAYGPPPPPPPPVYSWTGFYVGLNAGGIWDHGDATNTITNTFCQPGFGGCGGGAPVVAAAIAGVPLTFDNGDAGFIGGAQIGYNWQAGAFVFGVEADIQFTSLDNNINTFASVVVPGFPNNTVDTAGAYRNEIDWLGTVRGRLGWLATPAALLYVTGGLAYGHVQTDVAFEMNTTGPCGACLPGSSAASISDTRLGWTIGGGVEWMFAPHWTVKAEYLYYDLGSETLDNVVTTTSLGVPFYSVGIATEVEYTGSIARVGVNYKF